MPSRSLRTVAATALSLLASSPAWAADLQVTCPPGHRVYVDGDFRGMCTAEADGLYVDGLSAGHHEVTLRRSGRTDQTTAVRFSTAEGVAEVVLGQGHRATAAHNASDDHLRQVSSVMRRSIDVKRCFVAPYAAGTLPPRVETLFEIDADGAARNIEVVAPGSHLDDDAASCLVTAIGELRFPEDTRGRAISYPFLLR